MRSAAQVFKTAAFMAKRYKRFATQNKYPADLSGFKYPHCLERPRAAWMLWFGPCGTDRTKHRVKKMLSLGGTVGLGLRKKQPAIRTAFQDLLGFVRLIWPLKHARSQALIECSGHRHLIKIRRLGARLD